MLESASAYDFSANQALKHRDGPWAPVREWAHRTAAVLQAFFYPAATAVYRVPEQAASRPWHLPGRVKPTATAGWHLWAVTLQHEGMEHTADIGLASVA